MKGNTLADKISIIRSDDLQVQIGLELLDANLGLVEDISTDFAQGTVTHGNFRRIHSTFKGVVSRVLLWESARLRPYIILRDLLASEEYRWNLGVYVVETANRASAEDPKTFDVEGYDLTVLLDTPYGSTFSVSEADAYLTVVADLLDEAGVPSYFIDQTKAADTVTAPRSWEISEDNTYLRICNDLLSEITYRPIWMDREGVLQAVPYLNPNNAADVFTYDADLETTIIETGAVDNLDLWQSPNRFVFVADQPAELDGSDPKLPTEGDGLYTVTNQSDGPTSIDARGRVLSRLYRLRVHCQDCLVEQGDAIVEQAKHTIRHLRMDTGANPAHWHWDVSTVSHPALGVSGRWQSISWKLEMDEGTMRHEMRSL